MSSYWDEFLFEEMVSLMCRKISDIMIMFSQQFECLWKIHKFLDFLKTKFENRNFHGIQNCSKSTQICVYNTSRDGLTSYLFSKNFWHTRIRFPFLPTNISKNDPFSQIRPPRLVMVEFFGMSSYGPESSSIIKYEFWRKFYLFIMSSYLL